MKIVAVAALALVFGGGCKDKQPEKKKPSAESRAPASSTKPPALETPEVSGPGLVPAVGLGTKLTVSKTEIKVDGEAILAIGDDGMVDKSRLGNLISELERKSTSDAPLAISFDATLPYYRVSYVLDVLKKAGFRNLALLTGSGSKMIPIDLPDATEANRAGLRPVVTLQRNHVMLWSASGEEGTKNAPKLSVDLGSPPSFQPLTRALAEIAQRRWPDGKRAPEDLTIIVQLDRTSSAQLMLQALAAVRTDGTLTLFPNIFLAGGR